MPPAHKTSRSLTLFACFALFSGAWLVSVFFYYGNFAPRDLLRGETSPYTKALTGSGRADKSKLSQSSLSAEAAGVAGSGSNLSEAQAHAREPAQSGSSSPTAVRDKETQSTAATVVTNPVLTEHPNPLSPPQPALAGLSELTLALAGFPCS